MHIFTIAALAAMAMPFVNAQLSSIPQCAQNVTESAITAAGCTDADVHCFCTPAFMGSLQSQIGRTCSVSDQQITLGFAQSMCRSVGVNFDLPPNMSVSVATSTATATGTASLGPDISATAGTTTMVDTTAAMSATTGYASAKPFPMNTTRNGTLMSNGTMSPSSTSTPSFTGGAAAGDAVQWLGAVLIGMLAVAVLL